MVKCTACGAENRDIANYCLRCGQSVVVPPVREAPELIEPGTNLLQPFGQHGGCAYHPWLPAHINCAMCGVPVCMGCVRYIPGSAYCPLCYGRLFPPRITVPFYSAPMLRYQPNVYGRRP